MTASVATYKAGAHASDPHQGSEASLGSEFETQKPATQYMSALLLS